MAIYLLPYPLTSIEFKLWLESKDKDEIVGLIKNGDYCPVATVLKQTQKQVYVNDTYTEINFKKILNPGWVTEFTRAIDRNWSKVENDITAEKALEVLNNLFVCTSCNSNNPEGTACSREDCPW